MRIIHSQISEHEHIIRVLNGKGGSKSAHYYHNPELESVSCIRINLEEGWDETDWDSFSSFPDAAVNNIEDFTELCEALIAYGNGILEYEKLLPYLPY